jgi:hypothetical protein
MAMGQRVWASEDGTGWFLFPEDVRLAPGDHSIRDLLGRVRQVDRAELDPYVIDAASAREEARREVVGWLGKLEAGVGSVAQHMDQRQQGSGQSLGSLQQMLGMITQRLARPGELPPKGSAPSDLVSRLEAYAEQVVKDPDRIEQLKKAAQDLEAAAERLKAMTPKQ